MDVHLNLVDMEIVLRVLIVLFVLVDLVLEELTVLLILLMTVRFHLAMVMVIARIVLILFHVIVILDMPGVFAKRILMIVIHSLVKMEASAWMVSIPFHVTVQQVYLDVFVLNDLALRTVCMVIVLEKYVSVILAMVDIFVH